MESPSEEKRRSHVITIDPNETILTAFPYRPHNSLLDLLKGEPKVLGVSSAFSWIVSEGRKGAESLFLSTEVALCNHIQGGSWSPFLSAISSAMYPSTVREAHWSPSSPESY